MLGNTMDLYVVLNEVREFAKECVWKSKEECVNASDSVIEAYLKALMPEKDFGVFLKYRQLMLEEFRRSVKDELDFLNDKS